MQIGLVQEDNRELHPTRVKQRNFNNNLPAFRLASRFASLSFAANTQNTNNQRGLDDTSSIRGLDDTSSTPKEISNISEVFNVLIGYSDESVVVFKGANSIEELKALRCVSTFDGGIVSACVADWRDAVETLGYSSGWEDETESLANSTLVKFCPFRGFLSKHIADKVDYMRYRDNRMRMVDPSKQDVFDVLCWCFKHISCTELAIHFLEDEHEDWEKKYLMQRLEMHLRWKKAFWAFQLKRLDAMQPQSNEYDKFENVKEASQAKYVRQGNHSRRNVREEKRTAWKKRQRAQQERMKNLVPHAEERNNFVRLAVDADGQEPERPDNDELNELLSSVHDVLPESTDEDLDFWVNHLENIVILGWQVGRAQSFTDVFVAVVGYMKMNSDKPILRQVLSLIDEMTKHNPEDMEPHALTGTDVLQKWDLLKTNTVFTKISFLLTAAMSLSVCSIKKIDWTIGGLQLVSLEAAKQQLKAVDVIDAVINTFTWIADVGWRVFQEKSLLPILYSDNRMRDFNNDCDWVLANAEQAVAGNLGEINDFEKKVDDVLRTVSELKQAKDSGPTALWLQKRYSELVAIKFKIVAKHRNTAIRFAPFGVGITGPSGVGKSTLSKLVMKTALHAMGFDTDPKRIITKDMFDKFDSTYTSDILGMFMDDVGNGKSDFAQVSPTDIIIKFFNNMAAQAVKAELNAKGVVFIAFKVGVLTSNFRDYGVKCYTNKPEASLRRFIHTRTRIKPQYRLPGSVSLNTEHPDLADNSLTQDVWELDLEECFIYERKHGQDAYKFRILEVEVDGEMIHCEKLDLRTYLRVVVELAKRHKKVQESVMKRSNDFDGMDMCQDCKLPATMCQCPTPCSKDETYCEVTKKSLEPHSLDIGEVVVNAATKSLKSYFSRWFRPVTFANSLLGYSPIKSMATQSLSTELTKVLNDECTPAIVSLTPQWLFDSTLFKRSVVYWQQSAALYDVKRPLQLTLGIGTTMLGLSYLRGSKSGVALSLGATWGTTIGLWSHYRARLKHYESEYVNRRSALPDSIKSIRDSKTATGVFVAATLVVGLKLFRMWNSARLAKLSPNALTPGDMESQPSWFGFMMEKMSMKVDTSPNMVHSRPDDLVLAFQKNNLFWAHYERSDGSSSGTNVFFPRKSVAWIPRHVFHPKGDLKQPPVDYIDVTVHRHDRAGGKFTFRCELSSSSQHETCDLVCVYVPNCPDLKSRIDWLPKSCPYGSSMCKFLARTKDDFLVDRTCVTYCIAGHSGLQFMGGEYNSKNVQNGSCMGLLISDTKTPCIVGFHIAGEKGTDYGVMQTVTQADAHRMIEKLSQQPGVLLSANATDLPKEQYGRSLIVSEDIHPHCMAARLDSSAYVDVLGATKLRTQQKSQVEKSYLSDTVAEVTGIANKWGPPKLQPNWKGFNATLEHIVHPADMFTPSALERARQDWLKPLVPAMKEHARKEDFRPLKEIEMVLGVPGKRFLDAIPMQTGMGFPVFGKKSKFFEEIRDGEKLLNRIPNAEVKAEMQRLMDCWKRGERGYPVTSATLKDEPTPLEKEKVRVFQAVAVAFGLWIRKYFLPIARFLSLHPELSESAVGVNAFSNQWEELMNHANKYAEDNQVIAWDYSKYDVRMNSQMTRAVLKSFIDLARIGGYDEESLYIMEMMVADLVHPLIDYNGVMMMAFNMNTSGNNITVNINSTAGSLYVRLGFFDVYPDEKDFRSCVAAMTYGDDFKGSVHKDYRGFNFGSYKKFLAAHNMKITLPDKSEDQSDFLCDEDADFLKRHSNFIPEIGCSIGKLDEMSIFKSLHCNLKSKSASPVEVAVSCIESAMHEWFAHGRDVYNTRQQQILQVCEKLNLPVPAAKTTFDERVEHWQQKYTGQS